uniref:Uncharacterized protein n=1 Tax=Parascaris equorum TaxID=6256 RepID=A0A914RS66_PAREQ
MGTFAVKFRNGDLYEPFKLCVHRKEECYEMLIAKLAEYGHCSNGKTLAVQGFDGRLTAVRNSQCLWEVLEERRYCGGANCAISVEFYKPNERSQNGEDGLVYFRLKDGECCRRFSLKLNREDDAYKVLLNKLNQLGYKSNGRLLLCTENDGSRTVIEDCDSLWTLIEINSSGDSHATLQLEYYRPEKTREQNSTDEQTLDDDKISSLEQNVFTSCGITEEV